MAKAKKGRKPGKTRKNVVKRLKQIQKNWEVLKSFKTNS